jgi:hypothetical protein
LGNKTESLWRIRAQYELGLGFGLLAIQKQIYQKQ